MFSKAYAIASKFTFPVILSNRFSDGRVENGLGSFILLNDEGWIATAAHIVGAIIPGYQAAYTNNVEITPQNITHKSIWWGADGNNISTFHLLKENDLAIGKIENFKPQANAGYPVFVNPENMQPGRSLCKLGFPFHDVKGHFNSQTNRFSFEQGTLPIPRFPIEGMYTRNALVGKSADGQYEFLFLETSTPGLRGQSGGPIFDTDGKVWAIQSQTRHLPLGFSPKIVKDGKAIEENQFLNVGWGVHAKTLLQFLDNYGVKYQMA